MLRKLSTYFLASTCLLSLTGCAHKATDPSDPYEGFNRAMFGVNRVIDTVALKPAAKVYNFVTPNCLQKGITNGFDNIYEITTFPNDVLQGKVKFALVDMWRLIINSTIGIGGLFDVASRMGLPKHYQDFGMTLAYWEGTAKPAPYLVLPLLGSTTFRAGFGKIFDLAASPWPYGDFSTFIYPQILNYVSFRSNLLPADPLIWHSFDPYVFVRSAYLQRRSDLLETNLHKGTVSPAALQNNRHLNSTDFDPIGPNDVLSDVDMTGQH